MHVYVDVKASQVVDFIMPKKTLNILKVLGTSDAEVKITTIQSDFPHLTIISYRKSFRSMEIPQL